jgi:DNA repair exonuclease SbcCD nuclease subunit
MKFKFLHTADIHLGHRQYNVTTREQDMLSTFQQTLREAVQEGVDAVLLPGDLFDSRNVRPAVLQAAEQALDIIPDDVPVLVSPGNHDQNLSRRQMTWLEYLHRKDVITLLQSATPAVSRDDRPIEELYPSPAMADAGRGTGIGGTVPGYYEFSVDDLDGPVRVFGLEYRGGYIDTSLEDTATAIEAINDREGTAAATILLAHFGVAEEAPDLGASVKVSTMQPIQDLVDYLALGHIHKPYAGPDQGTWFFNPGSIEAHDTREAQWDLGYIIGEVQPVGEETDAEIVDEHYSSKRRPFYRFSFEVEIYDTWAELVDGYEAAIEDELPAIEAHCSDQRFTDSEGHPRDPVIDLRVTGELQFDRRDLDTEILEEIISEATDAVYVQSQDNVTTPTVLDQVDVEEETVFTSDGRLRTDMLEGGVFEQVANTTSYESNTEAFAETLAEAKELVVEEDASREVVADRLQQRRREAFEGGVGATSPEYEEVAGTADTGGVDSTTFEAIASGEQVDPVEAAQRASESVDDPSTGSQQASEATNGNESGSKSDSDDQDSNANSEQSTVNDARSIPDGGDN